MFSWLPVVALSIGVGFGAGMQQAGDCLPATPDALLANASLPATTAVVEYTYLASSPLPWGRSALVATRVWGSGLVERWVVSDRRSTGCPDIPIGERGQVLYLFVGSGAVEVLANEPVASHEAGALMVKFGEPRRVPVSGVDRVMAWLRVAPGLIASGAGVIALAIVLARRRRRRDRYLF